MGITSTLSLVAMLSSLLSVVCCGHIVIVVLWHSPWASHCCRLRWPHRPSWSSCVCDSWPLSLSSSPSSPSPSLSPSSSLSSPSLPLSPLPLSSSMVMSPWHLPWPSHHRRRCAGAGAGAIVVVVRQRRGMEVAVLSMQVAGSSLSSVDAEGGWWLHYQHRWQGHRHRLSMQREGGGCVIDAGGRVVVVVVVVVIC